MDRGDSNLRGFGSCVRHDRQPPRRPCGFTLVELLAVVSIIAVLATIIIPTLSRAKQVARRAKCAAQLNAIGKGMALYATDHEGRIPITEDNTTGTGDLSGAYAEYLIWQPAADGGAEYVQFGILVRQGHIDADAFFCPNRHRWIDRALAALPGVHSRSFDPASAGVDGMRSLGSYGQRDKLSGAPESTDGARAQALMFDMHYNGPGGEGSSRESHDDGINVLYSNSAVGFIAVPRLRSVDPQPDHWAKLDERRKEWSW